MYPVQCPKYTLQVVYTIQEVYAKFFDVSCPMYTLQVVYTIQEVYAKFFNISCTVSYVHLTGSVHYTRSVR